jgi:starvation-inducible outer membrane lipoprotein
MMRAFLLLAALALSGCASSPAVLTAPPQVARPLLRDTIPQSLLACLDEPNGGKVATNRQAATYVLDLKRAGRDCRQKLHSVGALIEGEGQ